MESLHIHHPMKTLTALMLLLITTSLVLLNSNLVSALNNFTIAKPNCIDRCGDIRIPFPFGTDKEECYDSRSFFTTCNQTYNPPKLFLMNSTVEITDISLDGQLTLMQFISHDCYDRNKTRISYNNPYIELPIPFIVNYTANKFTIVGCDTYGFVSGRRLVRDYQTGCTAMCNAKDDLIEGSCTGLGCCQTSIPKDVWRVDLSLATYGNYTSVFDFNNCSYAFLVKESAFNFSSNDLTTLKNVEMLPMVADWAMGNGTCEDAKMNRSSYACKSEHSECYKPDNGYGYRCSCLKGYEGNPYLYDGCKDIDECQESLHNCEIQKYCWNTPGSFSCKCSKGYEGDGLKNGKGCNRGETLVFKLVAGIALGIIILMLVACWVHLELKRRRLVLMRQRFFLQNGGTLLQEKLGRGGHSSDSPRLFFETDLQKATNNFNSSMIIGQGGFGTVYKGFLPDDRVVAIKKSKQVDPNLVDPKQVEQFVNEVMVLSQINHINVVKFLGCCVETPVPLLVYDFVTNGTLFDHIHNKMKSRFLTWEIRLRIATETANVLSYLHSSASPPIIHRDVKSTNILLDRTFTAKVSDFGASRLVRLDQTHQLTVVQGTLGYLDPEYLQTSQLTEKSDVYSFGVVLAELLTGMKALCYDRPEKDQNLAKCFLSAMKQDGLFQILDDSIVSERHKEELMKVASLAKSCLHVRGDDRPSMKEVAMELEGLRRKGKQHLWDRAGEHIVEEEESLLGFDGLVGHGGNYNISSAAFDSVHSNLKLHHGR